MKLKELNEAFDREQAIVELKKILDDHDRDELEEEMDWYGLEFEEDISDEEMREELIWFLSKDKHEENLKAWIGKQ